MTKKEIRKYILNMRDAVNAEQKEDWDSKIFTSLINSDFYRNANVIFAFVSFKSEVDTHRFINHAVRDNKVICVPRIKSKETGIEVFRIGNMEDLKTGYYGILEPKDSCLKVNDEDIDLILMPGVAFDREGGRVGYGAGFYDRYLAKLKEKADKIALAYHIQLLDKVPMDEFDVRIDGIITDEEILYTRN
jgi:5-formyltetrahydrofolate cyclo-ligase